MIETEFFSKSIEKDVRERLKTQNPDETIQNKNYNYIAKIATIFNIGKKFKTPQISVIYSLCNKNTLELHNIHQKAKLFSNLAQTIGDNDDEKNILCQTFNNYIEKLSTSDMDNILASKIVETYPKVFNLAKDDNINISIFYDKHREENVAFTRKEVFDKFYSHDYGVAAAYLGQIKTPIFMKRNLKSISDEVKRLEIMSQALEKLPPAKFMMFALHFDKYIEKLPNIDDDLVQGSIENVVPLIKNGKNKILNSVGNLWGTDIIDHGSSGFIFRCLTSKVTPYNITRLCRIAEQIPSSDDNRFEQIRLDAIAITDSFPRLRSYIHNQQPEQHKLLKRMVLYYDAMHNLNPDIDIPTRTAKLKRIVCYIEAKAPEYNLKDDDLFNIEKYDKIIWDSPKNKVRNINILRRLVNNTTPRTLEIPQINDPYTKHLLEDIINSPYPFVTHNTYGEYLQKLNNHLERKMKIGIIGIQPKTINSILWSERRGYQVLQNMDAGYQLKAFSSPWFKEIVRFYELTNSANDTPNTANLNKFLVKIKDDEMEIAYPKISMRISKQIIDLMKRQREDAKEYSDYIGNLDISVSEKEKQQNKITDSLHLKISRNMSGYSLAKALYDCNSPKPTPYKALERYMNERKNKRR